MIVFLILHYIATKDTIECVESIRNTIKCHDYKVVVVDNGSPNNSFKELEQHFGENNDIDILHSDTNLGFAKGNNYGFKYAKEKYKPQYIVMINNDTIISQGDFCDVLEDKYSKYKYAVLGPDIVTKDGIHQNPWIREGFTYKQLRLFRMKQRLRIMLSYIGIDRYIYKKLHSNDVRKNVKIGNLLDVPLHGAALIFSEKYIETHDGLDARTFLYFEEEILRFHCKNEGLLMMYSSDLQIFHKEDVSTKMANKRPGEKERNEFKNRIAASKEYEKLISE